MFVPGLGGLAIQLIGKVLEQSGNGGKSPTTRSPSRGGDVRAAKGPKDLLTVEEFGRRVGKHPKTVYRLVRKGKLPCVLDGRSVRFRPSDADAWVAQHLED